MPPIPKDISEQIEKLINSRNIFVFTTTTCPFCIKVKNLFKDSNFGYGNFELDKEANGAEVRRALFEKTGQKTVPNVFIKGKHIGGYSDTVTLHGSGDLSTLMAERDEHSFDYDLVVIGGGSGGLAASKEAKLLGKRVAVCDFVKPSPKGTTWGLGGTCVNVGCIPKKLMHQAAILGHSLHDAAKFGWAVDDAAHKLDWGTMVGAIQDHIGSLNWNYRVQLRTKGVEYLNSYAEFVNEHTLKTTNKKGVIKNITSKRFILATGERPRYPDIPGAKEYCITSDDLFSLPYSPGKTLCIGASYVSLECAGFVAGVGLDVTVMVRSILLRGFDQQMAERIGEYMSNHGVKFVRPAVPSKIEQLEAGSDGAPGVYRVTAVDQKSGKEFVDTYNTILVAIGRDPCTSNIGIENVGVKLNPKNGRVIVKNEATSADHVYAIGDIVNEGLQLTPVAIQAGRLLARRLYGSSSLEMDYTNVATTVFTPLEYGAIGLSEEDAVQQYGEANVEVYHSNYWPLEWTVAQRENDSCYAKVICLLPENERVLGMHILGPNAGEVAQGFGAAMKCGLTKKLLDSTVGIHPTVAEVLTTLDITKRSGESVVASGC